MQSNASHLSGMFIANLNRFVSLSCTSSGVEAANFVAHLLLQLEHFVAVQGPHPA
jgi:hypothetical protein